MLLTHSVANDKNAAHTDLIFMEISLEATQQLL